MMTENPTDTLNQRIGVLASRETEARILIPVIEALAKTFGREEVISVLRETIIGIARKQGREMASEFGDDANAFFETLKYWTQDNALEIEILEQSSNRLDFNVTRCRYAEIYTALGASDLGAVFSCNRDLALIEGFNPKARLSRTQTIMSGANHCNFRYDFFGDKKAESSEK